jgi:two-component system, NtrC family, nitrogen regulation sensor histidine kinase NtrY
MASSPLVFPAAGRFAFAVWLHALLIAALAFLAVEAALHGLYANAVLAAGATLLAVLSLARRASTADRALALFIDQSAVESFDEWGPSPAGFAVAEEAMRRAADALRATRAERSARIDYLQALLDSVAAALLAVEADGAVMPANRAALRLIGRPSARLAEIGVVGPEAATRLLALRPGGREIVTLADGRQMLAAAVRFGAQGAPAERLMALQDVALDLDVVELKAWQDLARVLTHEIMNSLTPIASLAESLHARLGAAEPPARTAEAVEAVEVIARRSRGLITFVERYRAATELPEPQPQVFPLNQLVRGVEALMAAGLKARGVALDVAVLPEDLTAYGDPVLLEQAVINLVRNGAEASAGAAEAGVQLVCRREGDQVLISVTDNGRGLAEQAKSQLFVPFFTTKLGGSGIGLSIARQIAMAHHGQLTAANHAPRGAVFVLALPMG